MLRGGLAGLGGRGGIGALDPVASPPVDWFGLAPKDAGGAYVAAQTRLMIAGLNSISGLLNNPLQAMKTDELQGAATGQVLLVVPHFFPRAGRINRIATRTNGAVGAAANPRIKMGVWSNGTLGGSSVMAGAAYPTVRLAQSDDLNPAGGANKLLETLITVNVEAGTYLWFGMVVNAAAASNQHTIAGLARNALYPIHGYTFDATTPTTIAQDGFTFSCGFRHAVTYVTTDDLPNPYPQTSPAVLSAGAAYDTVNIPAIGFGWVPA